MKSIVFIALLGLVLVSSTSYESFLGRATLCATRGNKCGGTSGKTCCGGLTCEDDFGGYGVCVGNVLCSSRGDSCDTEHPCCSGLECEDNPGVCVGNGIVEAFVCSGAGQACGGTTENAFICCPGYECEDNFNGYGMCVKVHATLCAEVGQACGGNSGQSCCDGYQCEDNFNGHGVCVV